MKKVLFILSGFSILLSSGCTSHFVYHQASPDARHAGPARTITPGELEAVLALVNNAGSLTKSIDTYRAYLDSNPLHKDAWTSLANQLILQATAYTSGLSAKRTLFLESMACCEAAMLLNPDFATARESGTPVWEACHTLGEEDMNAMLFWATAVLYTFREGMNLPEKVTHVEWLNHADQLLQHMETIDRSWNGGAIPFSRGIVKIALPRSKGGDKEVGLKWMDESVAMANDWMLCHWGRAKYGYPFSKNEHQRRSDLQRVIALDAETPREEIYWRRYFQEDARTMLRSMGAPHKP